METLFSAEYEISLYFQRLQLRRQCMCCTTADEGSQGAAWGLSLDIQFWLALMYFAELRLPVILYIYGVRLQALESKNFLWCFQQKSLETTDAGRWENEEKNYLKITLPTDAFCV